MADRFYSVIVGEKRAHQVTEGSSTSSEAIELRINDSAYSAGRVAINNAIEALREYLAHKENSPVG